MTPGQTCARLETYAQGSAAQLLQVARAGSAGAGPGATAARGWRHRGARLVRWELLRFKAFDCLQGHGVRPSANVYAVMQPLAERAAG